MPRTSKYKYNNALGEPTFTERVRIKVETYSLDREFSLADFRDIPTNVSSALKKLEDQGEIFLIERRKIEGQRYSRNFYKRSVYQEKTRVITFQGWEKVYPEFFSIPSFKIIQIIKVGERL